MGKYFGFLDLHAWQEGWSVAYSLGKINEWNWCHDFATLVPHVCIGIVCTRPLGSRVRRVRDPSRLILLLWEDKGQVSEEVMCWTRQDGGWLLSVVTCESHRNGAIFKFLLPVERSDFRINVFFFLSKNTLRGLLYEYVIFNVSLELWLCNKLIIIHDAIWYSLCPYIEEESFFFTLTNYI